MQFPVSFAVIFLATTALTLRIPHERRCLDDGCSDYPPCYGDPCHPYVLPGESSTHQHGGGSTHTNQQGLANVDNVLNNADINVLNLSKFNVLGSKNKQNSQTEAEGGKIVNA